MTLEGLARRAWRRAGLPPPPRLLANLATVVVLEVSGLVGGTNWQWWRAVGHVSLIVNGTTFSGRRIASKGRRFA